MDLALSLSPSLPGYWRSKFNTDRRGIQKLNIKFNAANPYLHTEYIWNPVNFYFSLMCECLTKHKHWFIDRESCFEKQQ